MNRDGHYARWHRYAHHKKFHWFVLVIYISSIIGGIIPFVSNNPSALAASNTWDMGTAGQYALSDENKIELVGGVAQLKGTATPGTNWIASSDGSNWSYNKPITIDNTGGSAQTDYQILITADTTGDSIQDDCDDIRFTTADKITSMPYWIDPGTCNTASTKIWVKVPSISAPPDTTTIYLYYGNSSAVSANNGVNTFQLFDDFDDNSFNTSKWTKVDAQGEITETGGKLSFGGGSTNSNWEQSVYAVSSFARANVSVEYDLVWTSNNASSDAFMMGWKNDGTAVSYTNLVYGYYNEGDSSCSSDCVNTFMYEDGNARPANATWSINTPYRIRVRMRSTGGAYYEKSTDGGTTWSLDYASAYSTETSLHPAWMLHSGNYTIDNARVRKWATTEPTSAIGSESLFYPIDSPTITSVTGQGFASISGFAETLGAGSTGTIKYQISTDDGSSWKWWTNSAWTTTTAGYTETNTATEINDHVGALSAGSFKWKAYLNSNGGQLPKLDAVALTYVWDSQAPPNPGSVVAKNASGGPTTLTSNNWYNYSTPSFSWTATTDTADTGNGEMVSGVAGYYVYFGTDNTASPKTARGIATDTGSGKHFQTGLTFTIGTDTSALENGKTYYLIVLTTDNAGNPVGDGTPADLFTYKYDNSAPSNPDISSLKLNISANQAGQDVYTFYWPALGASGSATDTDPNPSDPLISASGIDHYSYKLEGGEWTDTDENQVVMTDPNPSGGENTFYLMTYDLAGNVSSDMRTRTFSTPPGAPSNLSVSPATTISNPSTSNSFTFSWDPPADFTGTVKQYRFKVNAIPTEENTLDSQYRTPNESVGPLGFATQQGKNTFYVVTEGTTEGVNYSKVESVDFYVQTSAPMPPTNSSMEDISKRALDDYKVDLEWVAPANSSAIGVSYEIFMSVNDDSNFQKVAETTEETIKINDLTKGLKYYFKIRSVDNAQQYSDFSTFITPAPDLKDYVIPTGDYSSPPVLDGDISVTAKSTSASFVWATKDDKDYNHKAKGSVFYGKNTDALSGDSDGSIPSEPARVNNHSLRIKGLEPETTYWYQLIWEDENGNTGRSDVLSFKTDLKPLFSNVTASNPTLSSVMVGWTANKVVSAHVKTCKKDSTTCSDSYDVAMSGEEKSYNVRVTGLEHGTTYTNQVIGLDVDGNTVQSDKYSFSTLKMPIISKFRIETVSGSATTTVKCTWETEGVPTTSIINYGPSGGKVLSKASSDYVESHEIVISDLSDQTNYIFNAGGVDNYGNQAATSEDQSMTTPLDTRAPKVSDLAVEVDNSGQGEAAKVRVAVAWKSDEPATSQVQYGIGSGGELGSKSPKDGTLSNTHLVILTLEPNQIYSIQALSEDKAGNLASSDTTTVITGQPSKSVLQIVFQTLTKTFSFLGNFKKLFGI